MTRRRGVPCPTPAQWGGFAELERSLRSFPDTALSANPARTDTRVA